MPLEDRRLGQRKLLQPPPVAHNILEQAQLALPQYGAKEFESALRALRSCNLPLEHGTAVASGAFIETLLSEQGEARCHAFFAVRQAQKLVHPHLAKQIMQNSAAHPLVQKPGGTFCQQL